jgi:uncharacterized protein (TIGR03663 family)
VASPSGRARAVLVLAVLIAAALRFPALAARPMHADEAVHADKLGTLLETGRYAYDPSEYHGPTLYYLTLAAARLQGIRRYVDLDEATLRAVPAALGVALVAAHAGAGGVLGPWGAALAALLAALSPAMVFYSRYYIHETPLVLASFGALLAAWSWLRRPSAAAGLLGGTCAGLMLATKETAALALGALALALALTAVSTPDPDAPPGERAADRLGAFLHRHYAGLALAAALLVAATLFSSFGTRPGGVVDAVRAYGYYFERSGTPWHTHAWDYYLRLLAHVPAAGTPFWTEGLILVLAATGGVAAFTRSPEAGADPRGLRLLALYTLVLLAIYCAVPYKTPWCVLGFLHGMILLAGPGAVCLVRCARRAGARAAVALLLLGAATHLGWQAHAAAFRFPADPRNPYVYAHTGTDVFRVVSRLEELARAHPAGLALPVQVVSRENLWPLPWYLRRFPNVAWWTGVSGSAPAAPVVLITPDMEPALVRRLYELPPPGERELYVSAFERPVELRPQVELRGYVANGLWNQLQRLEPAPPVGR